MVDLPKSFPGSPCASYIDEPNVDNVTLPESCPIASNRSFSDLGYISIHFM